MDRERFVGDGDIVLRGEREHTVVDLGIALVAAIMRRLLHGVGEAVIAEIRVSHAPRGVGNQRHNRELDQSSDHVNGSDEACATTASA